MSCYNAVNWLEEAVRSVLMQTFTDFEFIIVDDGSTDMTLAMINRFAKEDSRIIVIAKPNTGLADSLNVGLRMAQGDWVARMDADDVCELTRLEKQVRFASCNPQVVFVGSGLIIIDEHGQRGPQFNYPQHHTALLSCLVTARRFPPHASALYRRTTVLEIGGYRGRIQRAEDWDLWLRLSEVGELACLREPLMRIRKHSEQISLTAGGRQQIVDCRLAIVSYLLRKAELEDPVSADEDEYKDFAKWLESRLESSGYFSFNEWKSRVRSSKGGAKMLSTYVDLSLNCLTHPLYFLQFVLERFAGDYFAIRVAKVLIANARK